jgi:hypothetical protein
MFSGLRCYVTSSISTIVDILAIFFHVYDRALSVIDSVTFSSIKTTLKSKLFMKTPTDGSGRSQAFSRYLWFGRHCCILTWSITSIMLPVKKFWNELLNIQWNFINFEDVKRCLLLCFSRQALTTFPTELKVGDSIRVVNIFPLPLLGALHKTVANGYF